LKKPNLFIAGHPRSGTSSLHDYLGQHPDIFMTAIKEPNYFAIDFRNESDGFHGKKLYFPFRTEKSYVSLYTDWRSEKVAGEASWTNFSSAVSAKRIHDFNPDAKVVIIFREPVDFLYSFHSAAVFALGEDRKEFHDALSMETDRKKGAFLSNRVITPSWLYYSEFINYSDQTNRYLSLFERDRIKIIIFDEFKNRTGPIFREILEFLEVDAAFSPEFSVVNPNKVLKWPRLKRAIMDSPYFRKTLRRVLSNNGYAGMKRFYKDKMVTYRPRPPLDPVIRLALMKKFKHEVARTSRLLDMDLTALWGYDEI
jgi:hypothetical protein